MDGKSAGKREVNIRLGEKGWDGNGARRGKKYMRMKKENGR